MFSIGISLVKNEEDFIESFVRWNLNFLDGFVIIDNNSTDGTKSILNALMYEGLPVCIADDDQSAFFQSQKTTNLLHRVGTIFPSEFIIPLDADELIECIDREEFKSVLSSIPQGGAGLWRWKTYLLSPDLFEIEERVRKPSAFRFHRKVESPGYSKIVIRISAHDIFDLIVDKGNHSLVSSKNIETKELDIPLAHFPIRSKSQIHKRVILGEMGKIIERKLNNNFYQNSGYQQKIILERLLSGDDISNDDLSDLSLNYAQIPGDKIWPDNVIESSKPHFAVDSKFDNLIQGNEPIVDIMRNFNNFYSEKEGLFDPSKNYKITSSSDNPITTAFSPDWFIENAYLDIPPFKYLFNRFLPESITDIGCGLGKHARLLSNLGASHVVGIDDIAPKRIFIPPTNYFQQDLSHPCDLNERFDLVICFEVAEHLSPGSDDILLDTLERHSRDLILFSAAAPGQPGIGHINCKPFEYWAEKWAERNWSPYIFETLSFRMLSSFSWGRQNPVILFKNDDALECKKTWGELIRIHKKDFLYYHNDYKIINNPLQEPIPSPHSINKQISGKQGLITKSDQINFKKFMNKRHRFILNLFHSLRFILGKFGLSGIVYKKYLQLIRSSTLFDENYYFSNNPIVLQTKIDPALHYLLYGGFEGRDPSNSFCSTWYLDTYPDVKRSKINPLVHYLKFGKFENREMNKAKRHHT